MLNFASKKSLPFTGQIRPSNPGLLDFLYSAVAILAIAVVPLLVFPSITGIDYKGTLYIFYDFYYNYKAYAVYGLSFIMLVITYISLRTGNFHGRLNIPLALFTAWAFVSAVLSQYPDTAFYGWAGRWQGFLAYLAYFAIFIFISGLVKIEKVKTVLIFLFISASVVAALELLQFYGLQPLQWIFRGINDGQIHSTIGNRDFVGSYMVLLCLTSVFYFLKSGDKKERIYLFAFSAVFFAGLVACLTRGAWIGAAAGFCLSLFLLIYKGGLRQVYKRLAVLLITFGIIALTLNITTGNSVSTRYNSIGRSVDLSNTDAALRSGSSRFYIYYRTAMVFASHPIIGTGPDSLGYYVGMDKEDSLKYLGTDKIICIDKAHSEYLEYAATMGLPSVVFYVWFILSIFIPCIKKRASFDPVIAGIFAGWTGYLAQAAFNIGVISVLPAFFTFAGILWKWSRGSSNNELTTKKQDA